jgi:hypothetical protein
MVINRDKFGDKIADAKERIDDEIANNNHSR